MSKMRQGPAKNGACLRIASILAASAAIAWLFCTLWNLPVSRSLLVYVGWLGVITLAALFVARHIPQSDLSYAIFYAVMLGPLCLFTLIVAMQFSVSLGREGLVAILASMVFAAFLVVLFWEHSGRDANAKIMLSQAYIFMVCGLVTLVSVVPPCSALQWRLRVILGAYWTTIALYSFVQTLGIVRSRALFQSLAAWFASALCTVFLGGLALSLMGQAELGRQHAEDQQPAEEWVCYGN